MLATVTGTASRERERERDEAAAASFPLTISLHCDQSRTHWTKRAASGLKGRGRDTSEGAQRGKKKRRERENRKNRTRARLAQGEPLIFLFFLSSLLAYDGFFSLKKGDTGSKGRESERKRERGDYTKHSRTTGVSAATAQFNVRPSNE